MSYSTDNLMLPEDQSILQIAIVEQESVDR